MAWPNGLPPQNSGDLTNRSTISAGSNNSSTSIGATTTTDLFTITGKGFVNEITGLILSVSTVAASSLGLEVLVDGSTVIPLYFLSGSFPVFTGVAAQGGAFGAAAANTLPSVRMNTPINFKRSITVRLRNFSATAGTFNGVFQAYAMT